MITLLDDAESTVIIKKSRFIGYACRISNEEQAQKFLTRRKKKYYDASHNCFAYVLESGVMRCSDDGEPQSTAGLPILEVVKRQRLVDVLIVVTRYFGGTLLGTGGLIRAYTKSASSCIDAAQKAEIIACSVFECTFSYNTWAKAQMLLEDNGFMLDDIEYTDSVRANISAVFGEESVLEKLVTSVSLGKAVLVPLGEKRIERKI